MNNKETINKMYHELRMSVVDIANALSISVEVVVASIDTPKWTC